MSLRIRDIRVYPVRGRSLPFSAPDGAIVMGLTSVQPVVGSLVVANVAAAADAWGSGEGSFLLLKRVDQIFPDSTGGHRMWLASEDEDGTLDSRRLGSCPTSCIRCVIVLTGFVRGSRPFIRRHPFDKRSTRGCLPGQR